ncbi:hypothetical protein FQN54_001185 [Arachnomyces sp. PD_36]|nr:hypothetical protein FQN54_001185 [Arachnomyces sp. PD_36]
MKKLLGTLNRRASQSLDKTPTYAEDSPEGTLLKALKSFCESGGGSGQTGDEYLYLPAIVDAAESSPNAAREASNQIRKYLSTPATSKGYVQYNAIMLIRILTDNPGSTFTRNIDLRFVNVVRQLLKDGRDMSVQQMLRETLEALQVQKADDANLGPLVDMWKKEKEKLEKKYGTSGGVAPTPGNGQQESYTGRQRRPRALPPPDELAARVQEARTSAKLLLQLVQSTPPAEILNNELLKEFATRCQAASRSITSYINCEDPAPDADTMLTLIETSDQLSVSMSKHHRAILSARKTAASAAASATASPAPAPMAATAPAPVPAPAPAQAPISMPTQAAPILPPVSNSPPLNYDHAAPSSYDNRQPIQPTAPPPAPPASRPSNPPRSTSTGGGYHYNPDDFQIENPFADRNAASDAPEVYDPSTHSNGTTAPTTTAPPQTTTHNYTAFQPPTPPQPHAYGAIDSSASNPTSNPTPLSIPSLPPISTPSFQQQYQQYYSQDPPQSQFAATPPRGYVPYNQNNHSTGMGGGAGAGRTPSITQESMIVSAFPPSSSGSGGGSGRGTGSASGAGGGGGDPSSYPFSPISPLDSNARVDPRRY